MIGLRITQQITHLVAYIQHDSVSLGDDLTAITRLILRHSLGLWMILRPQVESLPTGVAANKVLQLPTFRALSSATEQ